jgi:signal transduction histidine kinase
VTVDVEGEVQRRIDAANASRATYLSIAFGFTYLLGGIGDAVAMSTLRNHGFMALQLLSSFCVAALVHWVLPARVAALTFTASVLVSAALGGAHVAQFGGFDGPWFYGCYTVPPIFIAMLVSFRHRLLGTFGAALAFTGVYWLRRPDLFEYPMAHVPLVYLFTICGIGAGLGQWVFKLETSSFRDLARLEVAAERLEQQLRGGEGTELRAELARQLHDDMAQLITGARLQLDGLARREATRGAPVDRLTTLLDELSGNARRMLEQLRQPRSLGTLRDELARLQQEFRELSLAVDLVVDEAWVASAARDEAEVVVAIAREGLMNAVRHARASEATVSLQHHGGELTLLIMDNGGGRVASLREGHGLRGIRERARLLAGGVEVGDYEAGIRLAVTWPRRVTA